MSKSVYCVIGTRKAFTSKAQAYSYAALIDRRRGYDWDGDCAIGTQVFGFDAPSNATEVWIASCWSDRDRTEYYFAAPEGRGDCYIIQ